MEYTFIKHNTMKSYIFGLACMSSIFFCSCEQKTKNLINGIEYINLNSYFDNEYFYIDDIVDSIKLIFLEANENSILRGYLKNIILTDEYIY